MTLGAKVSSTARPADMIRSGGYVDPAFAVGSPQPKLIACALWDDSVDGHLPIQVSNGGMGLGVFIPSGAVVVHNFFNVLVVPVGPTAMGASLEGDFDLGASSAISGAPYSTVGMKQGAVIREDTTAVAFTTRILTTAIREIQAVATVAVTSAGRIAYYVEYVMLPATAQGAS